MKAIIGSLFLLSSLSVFSQGTGLTSITTRVNVQSDSARQADITGREWVAVGINRPYAIQLDSTRLIDGAPSYRFELKDDDNSLEGYSKGSTKGRAELSYCYATSADYSGLPDKTYLLDQALKMVYARGKGQCPQGTKWRYSFSIYVPSTLSPEVNTIFAQWHGMPSRTLVQNPKGKIMLLTREQFQRLNETMLFVKDKGYQKIQSINKEGKQTIKKGKLTGWKIEQGGYPPLAFGFSDGMFYIKANSDSKWMTDKTDRTLAGPLKNEIMQPIRSTYKISTIAYKCPFNEFPKDTWVSFTVDIDWSQYGGPNNKLERMGMLDVAMRYRQQNAQKTKHIVNNQPIALGRNDDHGYYFKFGIYRTGSSIVPVRYNLGGYHQYQRKE